MSEKESVCVCVDISGERSVSGTGYSLKLVNSKWKQKIIFLWGVYFYLFICVGIFFYFCLKKEKQTKQYIFVFSAYLAYSLGITNIFLLQLM